MSSQKNLEQNFWKLIASIRNPKEAEKLLKDMLTPAEIRSLSKRWHELQLLAKRIPHREVARRCGISISKVTRGARVLAGGTGGAWMFLRRLRKVK